MSIINYAVEILTDATGTDVDYGYVGGVFRFVTGRPGYTGDAPYPTWEDTTVNTHRWFEGWLLKDGMGNPNRRVDITRTGDYGTLSGFEFRIRNDQKFWDFLDTYDIWLCNRAVKVYVIIDGVFFQIWDGVISNEPYNETDYTFVCVDKFKTIHKAMPPKQVNKTTNPDADEQSLGTTIPITFGNVQYAKLIKLANKVTKETLIKHNTYYTGSNPEFKVAEIWDYLVFQPDYGVAYNKQVKMVVRGKQFVVDELVGKYLVAFRGGGANSSRLIRIVANTANINYNFPPEVFEYITIGIEEPLDSVPTTQFGSTAQKYGYKHAFSSVEDTWWFSIVDFTTEVSPSTGDFGGFIKDPVTGLIKIYRYDKDADLFIDVSEQLYAETLNGDFTTKVTLQASSVNKDGQIEVVSPVPFVCPGNATYIDFDPTTYKEMNQNVKAGMWSKSPYITLALVDGYDWENVSAVYLGVDFSIFKDTIPFSIYFNCRLRYETYDAYGVKTDWLSKISDNFFKYESGGGPRGILDATETMYHVLPKDYWRGHATAPAATHWGDYDVSKEGNPQRLGEEFKLPGDIIDACKNGMVQSIRICLEFEAEPTINIVDATLRIYEVGLFTTKYVDTIQGDLYGQVVGESSGRVQSNTVYGAFKLMLETYDKIPSTDIDYGNLPTMRGDWPVSRQMTEEKNSFTYLKELAEQSFVAIVPTRTGKRLLSAWRDDKTLVATHTETSIVRDSIQKFQKTEIKDLWNSFFLAYHYNQATKKYDRSLGVLTGGAISTFPPITDASWKDAVFGVNVTSYADAQALWGVCQRSYLRSKSQLIAPDSVSQLNWYADSSVVTATSSPGVSVDDSAYKFLNELCEWCTRQKETVTYKLPMSSTNLALELLDYIKFSDAIYTLNTQRPGWVTYIEVDTKNDQIILETTLNPVELAFDRVIIERGKFLNEITVTEAVNQDDTFSEPQQVTFS